MKEIVFKVLLPTFYFFLGAFLAGLAALGLAAGFLALAGAFLAGFLAALAFLGGAAFLAATFLGLTTFFSLLCSWFFGLDSLHLLWLLNLHQLEASSSLAALLGHLQCSLLDSSLQGHAEVLTSLGSVHLVVGADVLQDGLAGGAGPVLEGGDGGGDHHGVLGVGRGHLGLGNLLGLGSVGSHCCCCCWFGDILTNPM